MPKDKVAEKWSFIQSNLHTLLTSWLCCHTLYLICFKSSKNSTSLQNIKSIQISCDRFKLLRTSLVLLSFLSLCTIRSSGSICSDTFQQNVFFQSFKRIRHSRHWFYVSTLLFLGEFWKIKQKKKKKKKNSNSVVVVGLELQSSAKINWKI